MGGKFVLAVGGAVGLLGGAMYLTSQARIRACQDEKGITPSITIDPCFWEHRKVNTGGLILLLLGGVTASVGGGMVLLGA